MRIFLTNICLWRVCLFLFSDWTIVFNSSFSTFFDLVIEDKRTPPKTAIVVANKNFYSYYVLEMIGNPRKVSIEVLSKVTSLFSLSVKYTFYRSKSIIFFKLPLAA